MPNGRRLEVGDLVVQTDLARTLKRVIEAEEAGSRNGRVAGI